ncbi:antibiotic biosynthesis monooxygenase [Embleya sp. NBC_00896]|uniref:antibiotic biosynthesis monooxygenase family protein n=1 Tax=Embleya sp. NBC_00896 TaxID=2975961 RepID=UPI002F90D0E2|nr:antibiotic biosynthesis monooxygenase [Embleya sp. NBC_00896]
MTDRISFAPGQVVTVFRSRLRDEAAPEFGELAAEMLEAARSMPGFVDYKVYFADDGERVSVIVFDRLESQRAWAADPRHRAAQQAGRDRFYSEYSLQVSMCVEAWEFPAVG